MSRQVGRKRMGKLVRRIGQGVVIAVVAAGFGVAVAWWAGAFEEGIAPGQAEVAPVPPGPLERYVIDRVHPVQQEYFSESIGTLKAASRTQISSRVMAAIRKIHVRAGDVVKEGDVAQPGRPLLEVYDPASLRLEVPVMEHLAIRLQEGDALTVKIDSVKDQTFTATVDEIVPQAEAASRSLMVKVKLPPSPDLREGMFGRLMIPAGVRRHLCLNVRAIERIGQLEFVYVVDAEGRHPERRLIRTGRYGPPGPDGRPERVEVLSGLAANESVLVKKPAGETSPASSKREG